MATMPASITRDELRSALADGTVTVIDALPAAPYEQRHLPGALLGERVVPASPRSLLVEDEAEGRSADLLPDKGASVVTYSTDAGCGRGEGLAERLEGLGYTNVRIYRDGIADWVAAGLPVESGEKNS